MMPTKTAMGMIFNSDVSEVTSSSSPIAATLLDNRPSPPDVKLIIDCPIIAHPGIPPNSPQATFPVPKAMHSMEKLA